MEDKQEISKQDALKILAASEADETRQCNEEISATLKKYNRRLVISQEIVIVLAS